MISVNTQRKTLASAIFFATAFLFFSCKKTDRNIGNYQQPDFTTEINASISGFVTDEQDQPVNNAEVRFGSLTGTSDKYGFFELKNGQVIQNAATVTVIKPGYFKGIKTFIVSANQSLFCRIKLITKTITGTINSADGGTVSLSNRLKVVLPANAVVNAITGVSYTGPVNVSSFWIDPAGADLHKLMPGDLWGTKTDGAFTGLTTYGIAAIELSGSSGEVLQIAADKKATLTMEIPASILSNAPSTIPLWYFDETKGYWKEAGSATKNGTTYITEVSHFSFWSPCAPFTDVMFTCNVTDVSGNPLSHVRVKITSPAHGYGDNFTDSAGSVSGLIPSDASLLEIIDNYCVIYSRPISVINASPYNGTNQIRYQIENVILPPASVAAFSGTLVDCNDSPVSSGFVWITKGFTKYRFYTSGTFNIATLVCSGSEQIEVIAEDLNEFQQDVYNFSIAAGINNIGNLKACSTNSQQFINYTVDGQSFSLIHPTDIFSQFSADNTCFMGAHNSSSNKGVAFSFSAINIALSSTPDLWTFSCKEIDESNGVSSPTTSVPIHFTEYGLPNEFIAGSFSGTVYTPPPVVSPHVITCNFRVRRTN